MTNQITRLNPETLPDASQVGYSQISIVERLGLAYVSGQVAWRRDGQPVPDNIAEQSKIVLANARSVLKALNASPHDIILAKVFITDLNPERQEIVMGDLIALFDGAQPSLTGLGVEALGGPDLQLELELVIDVAQ